MKAKRVLAAVMAGAMTVSLAACGSSDSGTSAAGSSTQAATAENTGSDTAGDGEIWECVVPWPSIGETPSGFTDVENAVNAITEPEIGVHVTLNPIYCFDLNSQQTLAISSGDKLDLCLIMLETNASYVNNGSIIELTDLYNQYGSNIKANLGEAVEAGTVGDSLYSIPVGGVLGYSYGYLLRSDLLEKYGFDAENRTTTQDEIAEIFKAIKDGEGAAFYPMGLTDDDEFIRFDDLGASPSSGVLMLDGDTDTVVDMYETDEYAQYAQTTYEWAQNGWLSPDASTTDGATDLVKSGQYAGQTSSTQPGQDTWAATNAGYDMTSLTVIPTYSKTTDLSNISWGITSNCDNPEKAMQLIDLMFADNEIGTILTNGLEGQSYVVKDQDDAGHMIIAYPDGEDNTTVPYYNMFGVWPNNKAQMEPETLDYFTEVEEYNAGSEYSPAFGYTFDGSNYTTQIAAIDSVVAQYEETIRGGKADPASILPDFIQGLKDAGIDDVIAANQEQYDAWKAAQ